MYEYCYGDIKVLSFPVKERYKKKDVSQKYVNNDSSSYVVGDRLLNPPSVEESFSAFFTNFSGFVTFIYFCIGLRVDQILKQENEKENGKEK
jgi:hypothetical protein